jgi:integrase
MTPQPRLLDGVRERLRLKHYSIRTEQAYVDWIKRFILYLPKALHPCNPGSSCSMGRTPWATEVERFVTHLAVERNVAASTQNQALSAIVFLYKEVLGRELGHVEGARRPARVPVVLTEAEVRAVLAQRDGRHALMAGILYGAGLRLMECVRLRVKDVDFGYSQHRPRRQGPKIRT